MSRSGWERGSGIFPGLACVRSLLFHHIAEAVLPSKCGVFVMSMSHVEPVGSVGYAFMLCVVVGL
jgi:hypothetical protein